MYVAHITQVFPPSPLGFLLTLINALVAYLLIPNKYYGIFLASYAIVLGIGILWIDKD